MNVKTTDNDEDHQRPPSLDENEKEEEFSDSKSNRELFSTTGSSSSNNNNNSTSSVDTTGRRTLPPMVILPPPASWLQNDIHIDMEKKEEEEDDNDNNVISRKESDDLTMDSKNSNISAGGTPRKNELGISKRKMTQTLDSNSHSHSHLPSSNSSSISTSISINTSTNNSTSIVRSGANDTKIITVPNNTSTTEMINVPKPKTKHQKDAKINSKISQTMTDMTHHLLPNAARELVSTTARRAYHYARLSYASSRLSFPKRFSEVGSNVGGYHRDLLVEGIRDLDTGEILCSTLVRRRTNIGDGDVDGNNNNNNDDDIGDDDISLEGKDDNNNNTNNDTNYQHEDQIPKDAYAWEDEWDQARVSLPPFSSLPWVDRQLVKEWRTYDYAPPTTSETRTEAVESIEDVITTMDGFGTMDHSIPRRDRHREGYQTDDDDEDDDDEEDHDEFERAKIIKPQPLTRPPRENASSCYACRVKFGSTKLRHHCRLCGRSYCHDHSSWTHRLPHLGYDQDVPERVCSPCKQVLQSQNLAERIAWRIARCRDYLHDNSKEFRPYFDTGVDTVEDAVARLTRAALHMARSIPLGAQATVAVETLDIIRKHGLKGFYGLILRKEFMAAADLLCKVTGINKRAWPLSVHELSAAVFYALAQHRAMRGADPEREELIHTLKPVKKDDNEDDELIFRQSNEEKDAANYDDKEESIGLTIVSSKSSEDEGGDNILWGKETTTITRNGIAVIDETDKYDPMAESVLDLLALTNENVSCEHEKKNESPSIFRTTKKGTDGVKGMETVKEEDEKSTKLPFDPVCEPVPDSTLSSLIFYAPIGCNFVYAETAVDMQLLAAQQGWRLVYAHLQQESGREMADMPASALFVHSDQKIACLAIRGTATINDVVTDIRAVPVQFPELDMEQNESGGGIDCEEGWTSVSRGQGLALCGMAGAAYNLFRENIDTLLLFAQKGYRIRLTGHSLGGSVAALLGSLVQRHFEQRIRAGDKLGKIVGYDTEKTNDTGPSKANDLLSKSGVLRVYSYGSPACVDANLSDYAQSYVINCVLHDDVIPRLTPTSIRGLLKHLLRIRETWVKAHLADDLMAITERAKTVWAPRMRNGFTLLSEKKNSFKKYKKKLKLKRKISSRKLKHEGEKLKNVSSSEEEQKEPNALEEEDGLYYDGDCFYEAEGPLIEDSDEESVQESKEWSDGIVKDRSMTEEEWVPFENAEILQASANVSTEKSASDSPPVLLEEAPLPRMFIPGKIVHIYTHRGGYKATFVPRAFRELRRISLAGNMINDHMSKSYYEALLECSTIRTAKEELPEWTSFDEESTCFCCASRFTWASTSNSEAQEARDKHNCRSCGNLVCGPCSENRIPMPNMGITQPSRVCDQCYNDGLRSLMTRSFTESQSDTNNCKKSETCKIVSNDKEGNSRDLGYDNQHETPIKRKVLSKGKRSLVVDELASRVNATRTFS